MSRSDSPIRIPRDLNYATRYPLSERDVQGSPKVPGEPQYAPDVL